MESNNPDVQLTVAHLEILKKWLEKFRNGNKKERKVVMQNAWDEIRATVPGTGEIFRQAILYKKCREWFANNGRRRKKKGGYIRCKKWNWWQVVAEVKAEEVKEMMGVLSDGAKPGSSSYFAQYQKSVTQVVENLPDGEVDRLKEVAVQWTKQGPPEDVKQKNAERLGQKYVKEFTEQVFQQLGMRVLVISAHVNTEGMTCVASHDYNDEVGGGDAFTEKYPGWEKQPVMEIWGKYADSQMGRGIGEEGDSVPVVRSRKPKGLIELEVLEDGEPLIPEIESGKRGREVLQMEKDLIRAFITFHYRQATGNPKASVPWTALVADLAAFVDPEYLPEGVGLKEPSKLVSEETKKLLEFWRMRQDDEGVGMTFQFRAVKNRKGEMEPAGNIGAYRIENRGGRGKKRDKGKGKAKASAGRDHRSVEGESGGEGAIFDGLLRIDQERFSDDEVAGDRQGDAGTSKQAGKKRGSEHLDKPEPESSESSSESSESESSESSESSSESEAPSPRSGGGNADQRKGSKAKKPAEGLTKNAVVSRKYGKEADVPILASEVQRKEPAAATSAQAIADDMAGEGRPESRPKPRPAHKKGKQQDVGNSDMTVTTRATRSKEGPGHEAEPMADKPVVKRGSRKAAGIAEPTVEPMVGKRGRKATVPGARPQQITGRKRKADEMGPPADEPQVKRGRKTRSK